MNRTDTLSRTRRLLLALAWLCLAPGLLAQGEQWEVEVRSTPSGATVELDGEDAGLTTPATVTMSPGPHMLGFRLEDHEPLWLKVEQDRPVEVELKPLSTHVYLTSTPSPAGVELNGMHVGSTPLLLRDLEVREEGHQVQVGMQGHVARTLVLKVKDTVPFARHVRLESRFGDLQLSTRPGGAEILIDGELKGRTGPDDGLITISDLPEGEHEVLVRKQFYQPLRHTVTVARGQTKSVTLPPLQELPGRLKINTEPTGAMVFIDGALRDQRTNCTIEDLEPGHYTVRLEKKGYDPVQREAVIKSGLADTINVQLQSNVATVTLRTRPPGCEVILNGERVGVTKKNPNAPTASDLFTIGQLAPGVYELRVRHPRHEPWRKRFRLRKGQTLDLGAVELEEKWYPTHTLVKANGARERGHLVQRHDDGRIVWQPEEMRGTVTDELQPEEYRRLVPIE